MGLLLYPQDLMQAWELDSCSKGAPCRKRGKKRRRRDVVTRECIGWQKKARELVRWLSRLKIKLPTKFDDLSPLPRTHMVGGRQSALQRYSLVSILMPWYPYTCTRAHTHTEVRKANKL